MVLFLGDLAQTLRALRTANGTVNYAAKQISLLPATTLAEPLQTSTSIVARLQSKLFQLGLVATATTLGFTIASSQPYRVLELAY
jgi:hypothetical protein